MAREEHMTAPAIWLVRSGWAAVILLAGIGILAALFRLIYLVSVQRPDFVPDLRSFEDRYTIHPLLTLLHVTPGILFMILGPLQFAKRIRARHMRIHRWSGRIFVASGIVIGISALRLGFVMHWFQ